MVDGHNDTKQGIRTMKKATVLMWTTPEFKRVLKMNAAHLNLSLVDYQNQLIKNTKKKGGFNEFFEI